MPKCPCCALVLCVTLTAIGGFIGMAYLANDVLPNCTPPACISTDVDEHGVTHYYSMSGREYTKDQVDGKLDP
jgi:hypothetical protein